jgi:hypothetical protein
MLAVVFGGRIKMPKVQRHGNVPGKPVACGDLPGPAIEMIHVGLVPLVLIHKRPCIELQEVHNPHDERENDNSRNNVTLSPREPLIQTLD